MLTVAEQAVIFRAEKLVEKLGKTLQWRDQEIGFQEWLDLSLALQKRKEEEQKTS